jgi:hypothetical protein
MLTPFEKYIVCIMRNDREKAVALISWAEECHQQFDGVPRKPDDKP